MTEMQIVDELRCSLPFLELLVREAEPGEIDAVAGELARSAGASGVERARQLALRIRELLERRERRDVELTALYDTANDLARLNDVDSVLRSIARRARRLLGSDVAYLSLVDNLAAGSYIRVADGSVSPKLQNLRLPLGVGIGGVVAPQAQPFQTANYLSDDQLRHDDAVDDAVQDEGLVAILGVPLVASGQLLGVLFAADRRERTFPPEQVALLSSLATHAALAIEKTRLLQNATTALGELKRAHETIRSHSRSIERAAEAHERLTEVVLGGGGMSELARTVVSVLGGSILVLDSDGRAVAAAGAEAIRHPGGDGERVIAAQHLELEGWQAAPIAAGSDPLGTLLHHPAGESPAGEGAGPAETDRRILERAALVAALLLVWHRSIAEAELRSRGDVLRELLHGTASPESLRERARLVGVDIERRWWVVALRVEQDGHRLLAEASRLAHASEQLVDEFGEHVVIAVPQEGSADGRGLAAAAAMKLSERLGRPVTAGAAGPAAGAEAIRAAYREACRCVTTLLALGRRGEATDAQELGFIGLLLGEGNDVGGYVERTLGPVLGYDRERGTDLAGTLEQYFRHERNRARVAAALHVHPNTLAQRLRRVDRLLGPEWRRPESCLELQLALRLHRLTTHNLLTPATVPP